MWGIGLKDPQEEPLIYQDIANRFRFKFQDGLLSFKKKNSTILVNVNKYI